MRRARRAEGAGCGSPAAAGGPGAPPPSPRLIASPSARSGHWRRGGGQSCPPAAGARASAARSLPAAERCGREQRSGRSRERGSHGRGGRRRGRDSVPANCKCRAGVGQGARGVRAAEGDALRRTEGGRRVHRRGGEGAAGGAPPGLCSPLSSLCPRPAGVGEGGASNR